MSEPQPEYVWAYPPEKPRRGRIWLILVIALCAVVIAGAVPWAFLRPAEPSADPTSSPSASPSVSAPPSTSTPSAAPSPTQEPGETPPPVPDPSIDAFRDQVDGWLSDALTGLDIVSQSPAQDARAVLGNLRDDAQRLGEAIPPASIAAEWTDGVSAYSRALTALGEELAKGELSSLEDARSAVHELRALIEA